MPPWSLALFAALALGASAGEPDAAGEDERGFDALAVPLVSYNTDEGLGFGVAGGAFFYRPGVEPYAHAIGAQLFFTTGGVQSHFVRYDGPRFLGSQLRLEARLEYRRARFAPFFGLGNLSAPDYAGQIRSPRYSYFGRTAGGWVRARIGSERRDPRPYVGYEFQSVLVRPYTGSALAEERPLGLDGGPAGRVTAGLFWDTRDVERDPRSGGTADLWLRVANAATGSRYDFGNVGLAFSRFVPLGPRFVLASRLTGDWSFGDPPFFALPPLGGLADDKGIGGASSVRGLPLERYQGEWKLLGNLELRAQVGEIGLFGYTLDLRAVAFADAGRVWAAGFVNGPWYRFHGSGGVGLRLVRGAAAVRVDFGISDQFEALYVTFGQLLE